MYICVWAAKTSRDKRCGDMCVHGKERGREGEKEVHFELYKFISVIIRLFISIAFICMNLDASFKPQFPLQTQIKLLPIMNLVLLHTPLI